MVEQKKSIIINSNFLNSSNNSSTRKKKEKPSLQDKLIKPNTMKRFLLEKINSKRKAEQQNNKLNSNLPSNEEKEFSGDFKKSLEFLNSFIESKKHQNKDKKNYAKTLKHFNNSLIKNSLSTDNGKLTTQNINNSPIIRIHQDKNISKIENIDFNKNIVQPIQSFVQPPNNNITNPSISHNLYNFHNLMISKPEQTIQSPIISSQPMITQSSQVQPLHIEPLKAITTSPIINEVLPESLVEKPVISKSPLTIQSSSQSLSPIINNSEEFNIKSKIIVDNDEVTSPSTIVLKPDTPYGCLKTGNKPTYRTWNKTIKNNNIKFSNDSSGIMNCGNKIIHNKTEHRKKHNHRKIRKVSRKTVTRKFKLGKYGNVVGVLIKNNETRKKVQKEQGLLKRKSIHEIKKYLIEQKLLKIGSPAPNDVIRKMYEDSILTGEVENVGKGVILHNFLKDKDSKGF